MAFEIIMPKLGVDMQEGEIIEWKKQEGDVVNEGDILLEIMSDKTNMELEAEDSGVLLKITRQAGETVPVTEVIGYIGAEGEVVPLREAAVHARDALLLPGALLPPAAVVLLRDQLHLHAQHLQHRRVHRGSGRPAPPQHHDRQCHGAAHPHRLRHPLREGETAQRA